MNPSTLGSDSQDRSACRSLCIQQSPSLKTRESWFFSVNVQSVSKRQNHWTTSAPGLVIIVQGSTICFSRIGLYTHQLTHRWQGQSIRRLWQRSPSMCVCVCVHACMRVSTSPPAHTDFGGLVTEFFTLQKWLFWIFGNISTRYPVNGLLYYCITERNMGMPIND